MQITLVHQRVSNPVLPSRQEWFGHARSFMKPMSKFSFYSENCHSKASIYMGKFSSSMGHSNKNGLASRRNAINRKKISLFLLAAHILSTTPEITEMGKIKLISFNPLPPFLVIEWWRLSSSLRLFLALFLNQSHPSTWIEPQ